MLGNQEKKTRIEYECSLNKNLTFRMWYCISELIVLMTLLSLFGPMLMLSGWEIFLVASLLVLLVYLDTLSSLGRSTTEVKYCSML